METYYLKKLRKRYTIEYKTNGQVWFVDHRNQEVLKYESLADALVNMVYGMCGIGSGLEYERRKCERRKKLEFYNWCKDSIYNGTARHYSGFKAL